MLRFFLLISMLTTLLPVESSSADFIGNSFNLSWKKRREIINRKGIQKTRTVAFHALLYVSTKGRVFSRVTWQNQSGHREAHEIFPEEGNEIQSWMWQVHGDVLTGLGRIGRNGARRLDVRGSGSGCIVSVGVAKKAGDQAIRKKNYLGQPFQILSTEIEDTGCTFRQGNVFASP